MCAGTHGVLRRRGRVDYFAGNHLAIINLSPTPRDRYADLCVQAKVGAVFDW